MSTQFQYKTQCLPKTYARLPGHCSLSFKALSFIIDFTVVGHGTQNLLQAFHLIAHLQTGADMWDKLENLKWEIPKNSVGGDPRVCTTHSSSRPLVGAVYPLQLWMNAFYD